MRNNGKLVSVQISAEAYNLLCEKAKMVNDTVSRLVRVSLEAWLGRRESGGAGMAVRRRQWFFTDSGGGKKNTITLWVEDGIYSLLRERAKFEMCTMGKIIREVVGEIIGLPSSHPDVRGGGAERAEKKNGCSSGDGAAAPSAEIAAPATSDNRCFDFEHDPFVAHGIADFLDKAGAHRRAVESGRIVRSDIGSTVKKHYIKAWLDDELYLSLMAVVKKEGITAARLVRYVLRQWLRRREEQASRGQFEEQGGRIGRMEPSAVFLRKR